MDPLKEAMDQFISRDFREWQGLPTDGTLTSFRNYFANFTDDIGEAPLGEEFYQFLAVSVDGYAPPVRIWFSPQREEVVLLDAAYPELQPDLPSLLMALGEPAAKLDTYWGTLPISTGEWVYPRRGLTLFLSKDETIFHLAVFVPTSLVYYRDHLRLSLRKRRRPRPKVNDEK